MIWLKRIFLPLVLALPFWAVMTLGTDVLIGTPSLILLASSFVGLCATLVAIALIGARVAAGSLLQLAAGLFYGAALTFHLRESTAFPASSMTLLLTALLVGLAAGAFLRLTTGRRRQERASTRAEQYLPQDQPHGWLWLALTVLAALVIPTVIYNLGGLPRWHLLQQSKILGSPMQALLGDAPRTVEEADLAAKGATGDDAASQISGRFASGSVSFQADDTSPSIVFIMLDTLRADAFQMFGGETDLMPKLAKTLRQCQRFTDVLANSSWTRPSIASMHTGLLPEHHGSRGVKDPLDPAFDTFPELLQEAGYETVALVTNPTAGVISGLDQGFDQFAEIERDPYARAEIVNKAALTFLEERAAEYGTNAPPLLLYLHYLDPHEPYLSGRTPNGWSRASYLEAYADELAYLDEELSKAMPIIQARLGRNTLFFFVSDHGEEFFEHDLFGHGHTLYDEVVRIPAALCGGPFADGDIESRLEGRDVFSLMLSLANQSLVTNSDLYEWANERHRAVRSLSLSFAGFGNLQLRPYLASIYQRAFETPEEKIIWNGYGETWERYRHESDRERHNLGIQGDSEELLSRMNELTPAPWFRPDPIVITDDQKKRIGKIGYVQ